MANIHWTKPLALYSGITVHFPRGRSGDSRSDETRKRSVKFGETISPQPREDGRTKEERLKRKRKVDAAQADAVRREAGLSGA